MVSVRRPNPRGGRASGQSKSPMTYVKFIVIGGVVVLLLNLFMSGQPPPNDSSKGIFEIEQQRQQMLRENKQLSSRRTPPNNAIERLQRREHEEAPEEHPDLKKPAVKQPPHKSKIEEEHDEEDHMDKFREEQEQEKHDDIVASQKQEKQKKVAGDSHEDEEDEHNRVSGDGKEPAEEDTEMKRSHKKNEKIQYVAPNGDVLEKPEGTGPTKLGYVMDFVYERGHPRFRNDPTTGIERSRQNHAQKVAEALSETAVKSCEYMSGKQLLQEKTCRDSENHMVVYNGATFPRTWCGTLIPPQSAARMESHCTEPVHLFDMDFPPVSGQGMSPIVIHSQADGTVAEDSLENVICSVPCKKEKDMTGIGRFVQGTDWKVFQSYKDPNSMKEVQVELSKFKHDEYFSTTYFKSDVPLSFIDLNKHNLRNRPAVSFNSVLDKGSYIVNETPCGGTGSRRTRWFEVLSEQYSVDALGDCLHNKDLEAGESLETLEDRLRVMKKYKFNLGFEGSTSKDRFTELSYEAMLSGAVPILLGPPNGNRHFPKHSAIFANDFNHWDKLAAYVKEVASNKTLWESYHKWRSDEAALATFEQKYQFTKVTPDCRMCSWAYAKMYGLGWDHSLQRVQETYVPRKACFDVELGLVAKPFREIWTVSSNTLSPQTGESSCKTMSSVVDKTLQKDGSDDWKVVKSVVQHDSITDITIQEIKTKSPYDDVTLTFEFKDVNNTEGAFFRNSHSLVPTERGMLMSSATIQDHNSKVTVLANWVTSVSSPQQGVIRVVVKGKDVPDLHSDEVRRVRVITEDMGQLHDKMTEYFPSSFSKRMIQDFVDPLEIFYVDS